jgi:hypothetical protein
MPARRILRQFAHVADDDGQDLTLLQYEQF